MDSGKAMLFAALAAVTVMFLAVWIRAARRARSPMRVAPTALELAVGFVTNFFDTLGIGSFAPTTSMFKLWRMVPDERIPGTLNVGHTAPTVAEALIFIAIVNVGKEPVIAKVPLPPEPQVDVRLRSAHSFSPGALLHNADPRTLAVQLTSVVSGSEH